MLYYTPPSPAPAGVSGTATLVTASPRAGRLRVRAANSHTRHDQQKRVIINDDDDDDDDEDSGVSNSN